LDRQTVHPINGYPDAELLQQHEEQKKIMEFHEDYAALKGNFYYCVSRTIINIIIFKAPMLKRIKFSKQYHY
jgi:hypothetical protein